MKELKKKPKVTKETKKPVKKSVVKSKPVSNGIELQTSKLKEMVGRAVKGASFNSILPITSMMAIELKDNKLTLTTTDSNNYLYIIEDKVEGNDFYAVVIADTFAKLISKMTCEKIRFELKNNVLEVVGNGKYLIETQQEDDGEMIRFPNPIDETEFEPLESDIKLTTILSILNTAKPSLATDLEFPCYTGYYCGDRVVATNTYKMCGIDIQLWGDELEGCLISSELMDLLGIMTTEDIAVAVHENAMVFTSPDCIVYGKTMEEIDDFAIDDICNVLDMEFPAKCKIKKSSILQLLDRLSLFVTSFDKDEVNLAFTKEGLQVSSKAMSGTELVKYTESEDFTDFVCSVDINMLTSEIKAIAGDVVEIWYGEDNVLKLVEGNTIMAISLNEDSDEESEEDTDEDDAELPFDEEDDEVEDDEE